MGKARDIRPLLAKLARMTLVFMLVFWSSFRVEYLIAFADPGMQAEAPGDGAGAGGDAGGGGGAGDDGEPGDNSGGENGGGNGGDNGGETGGEGGETGGEGGPSSSEPAEIVAVEILDENGKAFENDATANEPELSFKAGDLPVEYQLKATVEVRGASFAVYRFPENGKLSGFSQESLADLSWKVTNPADPKVELDEEIAKVDEKGVLHIAEKGTYRVTCIAHVNATSQEMPEAITVVVGDASDDVPGDEDGRSSQSGGADDEAALQGANHAQDTLKVVSAGSFDAVAAVDPGVPAVKPADGDDGASEGEPLFNRTYTVDELEQSDSLPKTTSTFKLEESGKAIEVTGRGFDVMDLLKDVFSDAGLDIETADVQSVDFIDYRGVATNVPWDRLKSGRTLLAFESRVASSEGEGETGSGAGSGSAAGGQSGAAAGTDAPAVLANPADGAQSAGGGVPGDEPAADDAHDTGLLPNTRFRLLGDFLATFDAESLCWINTIRVNGHEAAENRLKVSIDYTPVPMGVDAELVAVPSYEISGSWDCVWEVSRDGGETSQVIGGAYGQTLTVPTNESTVGSYYRVTIENESGKDESGNPVVLSAQSEWVQLSALEDKPSVMLSYNPPQAGELAIFRSSIYGYKGDVSQLEYVWEWTEDGGESWAVVTGESKPTMKIPTEPISEDQATSGGAGDEQEAASLIYIRVRAIPPQGDPMVSNVQPLTVRVGSEDNTAGGADDNGTVDGENQPQGDPDQDEDLQDSTRQDTVPSAEPSGDQPTDPIDTPVDTPVDPQSELKPEPQQSSTVAPEPSYGAQEPASPTNVTEIDSITLEYATTPRQALDPNGGAEATPQVMGDPSQLYINDEVSELVYEQERAVEEYRASTTPGARWTALNTLDPDADDTTRVLEGNPFAPLVIPFSLGLTAAGGVEKLLFFRRQTQ